MNNLKIQPLSLTDCENKFKTGFYIVCIAGKFYAYEKKECTEKTKIIA